MKIKEKLLLSLSRKPGTSDYQSSRQEWSLDNALSILERVFPDFIRDIVGKNILDFGCGIGYQACAMAKKGASYVLGVDINQKDIIKAQELARELGLMQQVDFADTLQKHFKGKFDIVISQNSMEHFQNPVDVLNIMKEALSPKGLIFITFGPPWFAPYGSHTQFFTKVPWINILFDEKIIMNVRTQFRNDGATKYEDVEGGLNKMTVARFEQIISNSGMKLEYKKYDCVKGMNFLATIPLMRELFINQISSIICDLY